MNPFKIFGLFLLALVGAIWLIAGNDHLFRSTVPLEQRLVAYNDNIRKKAQQELLGLSPEIKREVAADLMPSLRREDPFVRKWAAISLALIGPGAREAIPALLQSVSDKEPEVSQASRVALTEIGIPDPKQLPALLQALQDPREPVRCEAAASLARMGPAAEEAVPVFIGYIEKPTATPSCFDEALGTLLSATPSSMAPVPELLTSGYREVRWKAVHVLAGAGAFTSQKAPFLLERLAEEKDPEIRGKLAKILGLPSALPEGRGPTLAAALRRSKDVNVRRSALEALKTTTPLPEGMESLWANALSDSDIGIRRYALESLRLSPQRASNALPLIAKAQRDPDPGVRCRAVETLIEWSAADRVAISLLVSDLQRNEEDARCASGALADTGLFHSAVTREMIRLLNTDRPEWRSRAAGVLMHLGARGKDALPALEKAQKDRISGATNAIRAIKAALPPTPTKTRRSRRR